MPITTRTRSETTARGVIQLNLVAGDTIELRKNGNVVESFTVPTGKTATGSVAVALTIQ